MALVVALALGAAACGDLPLSGTAQVFLTTDSGSTTGAAPGAWEAGIYPIFPADAGGDDATVPLLPAGDAAAVDGAESDASTSDSSAPTPADTGTAEDGGPIVEPGSDAGGDPGGGGGGHGGGPGPGGGH
ncbi:MAG TPA: hypothetical protein VGI39_45300 [Polyangiaceae bacterium]